MHEAARIANIAAMRMSRVSPPEESVEIGDSTSGGGKPGAIMPNSRASILNRFCRYVIL